jgi:hypothetical protein
MKIGNDFAFVLLNQSSIRPMLQQRVITHGPINLSLNSTTHVLEKIPSNLNVR